MGNVLKKNVIIGAKIRIMKIMEIVTRVIVIAIINVEKIN